MIIEGEYAWAKRIKIDAVDAARIPIPTAAKGFNLGRFEVPMLRLVLPNRLDIDSTIFEYPLIS